MAQGKETNPANAGTGHSYTPVWDGYGGEMYPFLNIKEEQKRKGFKVQFLMDKPRKETPNNFDQSATDFWFDVVYEGDLYTWTVSQISLIMELQKYKPLKNKIFKIQLVPVDEEFKKQYPKYKGKDRYKADYIDIREPEIREKKKTEDKDAISIEDIDDILE